MTRSLPPFPTGDLREWANQLYEYLTSRELIEAETLPAPVQLPNRVADERAVTPGILMYDGTANRPNYSDGAVWQPVGTMSWRGEWAGGNFYPYDVVRDGQWTMVCINPTTDRPAPQPVGNLAWVSEIIGALTLASQTPVNESQYIVLNNFEFGSAGVVTEYRYQVPDVTGNVRYRLYAIKDFGQPDQEVIQLIGTHVPVQVDTWITVPVGINFVLPGNTIALALVMTGAIQSSTFTAPWDYKNNNTTTPGDGEAIFRNNQTQIRYANVDKNGINQRTNLLSVAAGGTISFAGSTWDITGTSSTAARVDFDVTPNQGRPAEAQYDTTFTWGDPTPLPYKRDDNFYSSEPKIAGFEGVTLGSTTQNNHGYALDVRVQEYTASEDWDLVAYSDLDLGT